MQTIIINTENRYYKQMINTFYNWWKDIKKISYEEIYNQYLPTLNKEELPNLYGIIINDTLIAMYEINEKDGIDDEPYEPYIASIYVMEEYRHQGYLNIIMEDACNKIKEMGYKKAYLHSKHENLYERYGFKMFKEVTTKQGKKRLFEKEL